MKENELKFMICITDVSAWAQYEDPDDYEGLIDFYIKEFADMYNISLKRALELVDMSIAYLEETFENMAKQDIKPFNPEEYK